MKPIERIIIGDNLDFAQKFYFLSSFFLFGFLIIGIITSGKIEFIEILIMIIFSLIFISLIAFVYSKKGISIENNDLYKVYFTFGILCFKKLIDFNDKGVVSILSSRKRKGIGMYSISQPEISDEFYLYDIYFLNEKHTKKDLLISGSKKKAIEKAVKLIKNRLGLRNEIYSPDFN